MSDCFDADVIIFAAEPGHPLGRRIMTLLSAAADSRLAGHGSVVLVPEVLSKPLRSGTALEAEVLTSLLSRLDLHAVTREVADFAAALGSRHRLRAADAIHLATAVTIGADRFLTNNRRDFPKSITEVDIVYPDELPEPDL